MQVLLEIEAIRWDIGNKCIWWDVWPTRDVHPSEAMMHFLPVSDFPLYFLKIFRLRVEIFQFDLFQKKFRFSFPIFLITFCSRLLQILNVPLFSLNSTFPFLYQENYCFPHTFLKFSPDFEKIYLFFYILYMIFVSPSLTMMHLCITQCTYWTPMWPTTCNGAIQLLQKRSKPKLKNFF